MTSAKNSGVSECVHPHSLKPLSEGHSPVVTERPLLNCCRNDRLADTDVPACLPTAGGNRVGRRRQSSPCRAQLVPDELPGLLDPPSGGAVGDSQDSSDDPGCPALHRREQRLLKRAWKALEHTSNLFERLSLLDPGIDVWAGAGQVGVSEGLGPDRAPRRRPHSQRRQLPTQAPRRERTTQRPPRAGRLNTQQTVVPFSTSEPGSQFGERRQSGRS
jgi:hypothetical protein